MARGDLLKRKFDHVATCITFWHHIDALLRGCLADHFFWHTNLGVLITGGLVKLQGGPLLFSLFIYLFIYYEMSFFQHSDKLVPKSGPALEKKF